MEKYENQFTVEGFLEYLSNGISQIYIPSEWMLGMFLYTKLKSLGFVFFYQVPFLNFIKNYLNIEEIKGGNYKCSAGKVGSFEVESEMMKPEYSNKNIRTLVIKKTEPCPFNL